MLLKISNIINAYFYLFTKKLVTKVPANNIYVGILQYCFTIYLIIESGIYVLVYSTATKSNKKAIQKTIPNETQFAQNIYNTADNLPYFILNLEMLRSFSLWVFFNCWENVP